MFAIKGGGDSIGDSIFTNNKVNISMRRNILYLHLLSTDTQNTKQIVFIDDQNIDEISKCKRWNA